MLAPLLNLVKSAVGIKSIKYFIDSSFRAKVTPVPGSALYCDLWVGAEHSGIYLGNSNISNIVVHGVGECSVQRNRPKDFTSKSTLGSKIYVSCDEFGAVGHEKVATHAEEAIGERSFYGLVFKNCHKFSTRCLLQVETIEEVGFFEGVSLGLTEGWEPTILELKKTAKERIKATKWRLWDWENEGVVDEPDWQANQEYFSDLPLKQDNIALITVEKFQLHEYLNEIAGENIPNEVLTHLKNYKQLLTKISDKYEEVKDFLSLFPNADFSFNDLKVLNDDFYQLAKLLQENNDIKNLLKKMGRHYISEYKKKQSKVHQMSNCEVYGTHKSSDVMRVLPSELVNLEDDTLETLFYARLLEGNLMSYELAGVTTANDAEKEEAKEITGPIIACLDTSGSMQGMPIKKAKALLLALANILEKEKRNLHVLLFGSKGELKEFSLQEKNINDAASLLKFLQHSFGGDTDFETPLNLALEIIKNSPNYKKADVLMISDGDCNLSSEFKDKIKAQKDNLNCMVYSVLCNGVRVNDDFSDEVILL